MAEDALPDEIEVTGRTPSGIVMALRHRSLPIEGVQFHPESVLTEGGYRMVANWLRSCGVSIDEGLVQRLSAELDAMRAGAFAGVP